MVSNIKLSLTLAKRGWGVREWISQIGLLPRVIHLKLLLDIVPSSSADVTRALQGPLTKWTKMKWTFKWITTGQQFRWYTLDQFNDQIGLTKL